MLPTKTQTVNGIEDYVPRDGNHEENPVLRGRSVNSDYLTE
jgi:hypothetical protein